MAANPNNPYDLPAFYGWSMPQFDNWLKNPSMPDFDKANYDYAQRLILSGVMGTGQAGLNATYSQQYTNVSTNAAWGNIYNSDTQKYTQMTPDQVKQYQTWAQGYYPLSQQDLTTQQNNANRPRLQATGTPRGGGAPPPSSIGYLGNQPLNLATPTLLGGQQQ